MATMTIPAQATIRRPGSVAAPVRLTARGRRLARTAVVALALLVVLAFGVLSRMPADAGSAPTAPATTTVVVQPGQSLWQVAQSVAPTADVRETIERILVLNNLEGSGAAQVRPGQKLIVPAAG